MAFAVAPQTVVRCNAKLAKAPVSVFQSSHAPSAASVSAELTLSLCLLGAPGGSTFRDLGLFIEIHPGQGEKSETDFQRAPSVRSLFRTGAVGKEGVAFQVLESFVLKT